MGKRVQLALIALVFFASTAGACRAAQSSRAQVLVLGVAHLVSRNDVHNSTFEDSPLTRKRQLQIAEVVRRLARFRPTKVLVESPFGDPALNQKYRAYLGARFPLPANEIYQFGFRLAARSANKAIYPVDTDGPTLIDDGTPTGKRITAFLKAHFNGVSDARFAEYLARSNALERHGSYLDLLRYLNTDAAITANASWSSVMDGMGRSSDYAGSAYVSQWYARNCYIFSNILSVTHSGDRVVVIMGQGHEYLLREFVRLNPALVAIDPLTYLNQ